MFTIVAKSQAAFHVSLDAMIYPQGSPESSELLGKQMCIRDRPITVCESNFIVHYINCGHKHARDLQDYKTLLQEYDREAV